MRLCSRNSGDSSALLSIAPCAAAAWTLSMAMPQTAIVATRRISLMFMRLPREIDTHDLTAICVPAISAGRPAPSWRRRRSAPPPAAARSWPWPRSARQPAPPLASSRPSLRCASAVARERRALVPVGGARAVGREARLGRRRQRIVERGELELGRRVAGLGGAAEHQEGGGHVARLGVVARLGQHRLGRGLGREIFADGVAHGFPGALGVRNGCRRGRRRCRRRRGDGRRLLLEIGRVGVVAAAGERHEHEGRDQPAGAAGALGRAAIERARGAQLGSRRRRRWRRDRRFRLSGSGAGAAERRRLGWPRRRRTVSS